MKIESNCSRREFFAAVGLGATMAVQPFSAWADTLKIDRPEADPGGSSAVKSATWTAQVSQDNNRTKWGSDDADCKSSI